MNAEKKSSNDCNREHKETYKYDSKQTILVFQQNHSAEAKIRGVRKYGRDCFDIRVISIDMSLPDVIDNSTDILPQHFSADLVLDFLKHTDLSHDLGIMCRDRKIPVIASGKKSRDKWVIAPPT